MENGELQIHKTTVMGKGHKDYLSVDQKIVPFFNFALLSCHIVKYNNDGNIDNG